MAGYGADFHEIQIGILEKAAGGLMPKVVKTEVGQSCRFAGPLHDLGNGRGAFFISSLSASSQAVVPMRYMAVYPRLKSFSALVG